ncbi:Cation efflux family protein [Corynebacterium occultum]|uniref:Cation efflux family protein n=1 Tax=Corynebacterium occultum TaxID=2675219 RepID=A0A6B8W5L2_9CORY|nr:cation diffusion facilitator family transporter [Corynebacterium occultum]QGU06605.1 Cation efflux family protein [Corynebacterium occultum]
MSPSTEPGVGSGIESLPEKQREILHKAVRLEWITIAWILVTVVSVGLVAGQSQAMRSAWFEDMISLVPPIAFLIATRIIKNPPNRRHPYGPHRAIAVAHLVAGLALFVMGAYLVYESLSALLKQEKPPVGLLVLFGQDIWSGWLMIAVMVLTSIPMVIIGRIKLKLAEPLHDKVLYADADMARADWGTALATIVGVLGIGLGFWWADSVAALVISASILRDGVSNIRAAIEGLSDARATRYDNSGPHPLGEEVEDLAGKFSWVEQARARVRDQGHVFHTEMFVVPVQGHIPSLGELAELQQQIIDLDWKFQDVVVVPVRELNPRQVPAD